MLSIVMAFELQYFHTRFTFYLRIYICDLNLFLYKYPMAILYQRANGVLQYFKRRCDNVVTI